MSLIYCYGIIGNSENLEINGFENNGVYLIPFKDIIGVVSDVSEEKFSQESIDNNVKDMKWLTINGQIHEKVVDKVMEKTTVIPMKFCTIFKNKKHVEEMLEEKYGDFKFNLNEVNGKVEMTVKVYFDSTPFRKAILEENKEIRELEKQKKQKTEGAAYFDEQKIEILLKEKVRQKLNHSTVKIFEQIKEIAERSKQNELLDKKLTGRDMLLNGVFLIGKENIDKFKEGIDGIKATHKDFEFQVWGPFPAYNFIK